ncbi:type I-F CRISPR-associated protein Csy3 [Acidiferrobacter thiooxydans]|jgi:CRISPR-associated protein Csy3|uniref:type I-F CRISPR-associated protein Csy3 n=1 Tax=Acidiferrobacter thiooxydans TaxID=163359 RepID=UPI000A056586|nr:type I-F CRISPR-associated protein Csy3 [Acidiferrobacter thiooxydans]MDA8191987.1 type I-F CRISPR-associated protein Csy3 [Gammaproteobacteria bacterium]UEN99382.1 type I-F CRISPR-associated protein Csy3 [Acidiferrobacter thiooxydans]
MSIKIPSVLSVQRGTIVTDGIMSSLVMKDSKTETRPVRVVRHGIRGVLPKKEKDGVSNPQRTESAKTVSDAIGLAVSFDFRTISARKNLIFACSEEPTRQAINAFIDRFFKDNVQEFEEVCRRYARNILNGRWLWRNRILGDVTVSATIPGKDEPYRSDGSRTKFTGHTKDGYTDEEIALAKEVIAAGLLGVSGSPSVHVEGRVMFGFTGQVEVFPSQNMVTSKPKGFARSLYKVNVIPRKTLMDIMGSAKNDGEEAGEFAADMIDMGWAALRDQKIGNAIRTIDTWYPGSDGTPIPVEPNGASLEHNKLHREAKGTGWRDLLTKVDEIKPSETFNPDAAFLIALLVRGGVFSEKQ